MKSNYVQRTAAIVSLLLSAGIASASYDGQATYLGQQTGGLGGGGPFVFQASGGLENRIHGLDGSNRWLTFCVEENEYIVQGATYDAVINSIALMGGLGNLAPAPFAYSQSIGWSGPVNGGDPLDSRTAFLYSKFMGGHLDTIVPGFAYNDMSGASGAALQHAIWFFENEITSINTSAGSLEKALVDAANNAVYGMAPTWTGLGNVRDLNLYNGAPPYGPLNQSQLVIIPLPGETAMASLGLVGLVSVRGLRRRRS